MKGTSAEKAECATCTRWSSPRAEWRITVHLLEGALYKHAHTYKDTHMPMYTCKHTHHTHVCTQGHKYIMYTVHPIYRDTQTHAYVMYKHTDTPKHAHTDIHNIQIQIKIHTIIHIFSIKINFSIFKPSTVYNEHKAYDVWLPSVKLSSRNREKRINCSLI